MISMKGLSIWIGNGAGQLFPLELDSLAYMIFHGARKLDMKLLNIALYALGLVRYKIKTNWHLVTFSLVLNDTKCHV